MARHVTNANLFRSFTVAGHIDTPYAMPNETGKTIYVLRGLKMPMSRLWPQVKHFE